MLKILALTANLSHIPRVQKLGLRPMALAFYIPGQAKSWLKPKVRPSLAQLGLAWLGPASGFRPEPAHHYLFPPLSSHSISDGQESGWGLAGFWWVLAR